jgi:hypothetical protein
VALIAEVAATIEMPSGSGDLSQERQARGALLDANQARDAVAASIAVTSTGLSNNTVCAGAT